MPRQPNMRRPGGPGPQAPAGPAKKGTLTRLLKLLVQSFPALVPAAALCILFSAGVSAVPAIFQQKVIAIIEEWFLSGDWEAARAQIFPVIGVLIGLYVLSAISVVLYSQLMAFITQGFLYKVRRAMFNGMQDLPLRFFDTHRHGDIMSYYTNDVDALRQLVSQALPSILRSGVIVLVVFGIMLYYSLWMTLLVVLGVLLMTLVSKKVGGGSAKYFVRQQRSLGKSEGYIQEMMNGQKVVKVFCHEDIAQREFDEINDWHNRKVRCTGNLYSPVETLYRFSGETLTAKHYIQYLKDKFEPLYGI